MQIHSFSTQSAWNACPFRHVSTTASLRRSFRLRKDHQGASAEAHTPEATQTEFLIYEEVTQYLPRPGERPRLIVLMGKCTVTPVDTEKKPLITPIISGKQPVTEGRIMCLRYISVHSGNCYVGVVTGSLGARITELKQKVIAENPRRYGLAVPRKCFWLCFPLTLISHNIKTTDM